MKREMLLGVLVLAVAFWVFSQASGKAAPATTTTPADGYTVHVTAPHLVNGMVMGPYHHYCKVITGDPTIVCQIYDNTDPKAIMSQVEFIWAKKLTRPDVSLARWNDLWHDHATEIAGGRVKVLDLLPDKAKEVADLIATTDGIIYSFEFDAKGVPTGKVIHAQAVGHVPMTAVDYEKSAESK